MSNSIGLQNMSILLSAYACQPDTGSEPGTGWNWFAALLKMNVNVHLITALEHRAGIESYLRKHDPDSLTRIHYVK